MNLYKTQKNNKLTYKRTQNISYGFTIVEAMVAIFILTISVSAMLNVTASAAISARYSRNEITANYLLQEAIDSVKNSRDTIAFQMKDLGGGWNNFLSRYGYPGNKCFSNYGCDFKMDVFDPTSSLGGDILDCSSSGCPPLSYNANGGTSLFYNHITGTGTVASIFTRKVNMVISPSNPDEVKVTAVVTWNNNASAATRTQTLEISLLNWQK